MKEWHGHTGDPNTPAARTSRAALVEAAQQKSGIRDRADYIAVLAAGRKVLDCGIVGHTLDATRDPDWLHGRIRNVARETLGVDILDDVIVSLRAKGYNVRTLDITKEALPEKFELISCCEIIEHIEDLGAAFANLSAMLERGGRLVLTTPYPWYINCILKNLRRRSMLSESVDHVGWHEPFTLFELGRRHGLRLEKYAGLLVTKTYGLASRVFFGLTGFLVAIGFKHELFSKSLLYEFVKDEPLPAAA